MNKSRLAHSTGLAGEEIALRYLLSQGYRHVQSRYRTQRGEIDLILWQGDTLVFVEVKYRRHGLPGEGLAAINAAKLQRWMEACAEYLYTHDLSCPVRLDVVEITPAGIEHVENVSI